MKKLLTFTAAFILSIGAASAADIFNLTDTWNNAGSTFDAIKMDVTDTASQADSTLLNLGIGGTSLLYVNKSGTLFIKETADAVADAASYGQIWVNTAAPNELWFTDDAGTDFQLSGAFLSDASVQATGTIDSTVGFRGPAYLVDDVTGIYRNLSGSYLYISGSNNVDSGFNMTMYGQTHGTKAKDVEWKADAAVILHYDNSANLYDFQSEAITTTGIISGIGSGLTGTGASYTAGNVTTNANLTGHVTSIGNAAVLGSFTLAQLNTAISDGTAGAAFDTIYTADDNYGIGTAAVDSITTGDRNIGIGTNACTAEQAGNDNLCIGISAGLNLDSGTSNILIGNYAGDALSPGADSNIAIGQNALGAGTTNTDKNTVIGFGAGTIQTQGDYNVYLGYQSGSNHKGDASIFIGSTASPASNNNGVDNATAVGFGAGGGAYTTALGYQALKAVERLGLGNVAVGYDSSKLVYQGTYNTSIGYQSAITLTEGDENITIGRNVEPASITGHHQLNIGDAINGYMSALSDVDYSGNNLTVSGSSAYATATTNLDGGDMVVQGGDAATTGIGIGGDLTLEGGAKGSTGSRGFVRIPDLVIHDLDAGLTADAGSAQGGLPLTASYNEISTVGTTGDSATLYAAQAGIKQTVMNNGANSMDIFPASGDDLGAGANTAVALAAGNNITYFAIDATNWETL